MTEELKLAIEGLGFLITVGLILWRLSAATTTFTLIGQQQAQEIREIKLAMEKVEAAIALIAVQDVKITSTNVRVDQIERRSDERFARLETMLDELRHGDGIIRRPS